MSSHSGLVLGAVTLEEEAPFEYQGARAKERNLGGGTLTSEQPYADLGGCSPDRLRSRRLSSLSIILLRLASTSDNVTAQDYQSIAAKRAGCHYPGRIRNGSATVRAVPCRCGDAASLRSSNHWQIGALTARLASQS